MIGERHDAITDDLAGFVALSGHKHDIAGRHHMNRRCDCLSAISDFTRADGTRKNFLPDLRRLLAARIIVRHNSDIRPLDGNSAHDRTLAFVPIAAATEYGNQTPCCKRPARVERRSQRFGFMRVIDDRQATVPFSDDFEAAGDTLEAAERLENRTGILPNGDGKTSRDESILHLIGTDQRQIDVVLSSLREHADHLLKPSRVSDIRFSVSPAAPTVSNTQTPLFGSRSNLIRVSPIGIDDRWLSRLQKLGEQPKLRVEIRFDARMIIHVIAAEVRECRGRKLDTIEAMLIEPM